MSEKKTKSVTIKLSKYTLASISLDIAWSIYLEEAQYRERKPIKKKEFAEIMDPYLPTIMDDVNELFMKEILSQMEIDGAFMGRFYEEEEEDNEFDMDLSFLDDIEL